MNLLKKLLILTVLAGMLSSCSKPVETPPQNSTDKPVMTVQFIDVGQGDAILVECDEKAMLIDGGDKTCSQKMYAILKEKNLNELEYVVATSLNAEHIGGLAGALNYSTANAMYACVSLYMIQTHFCIFYINYSFDY